MQIAGARILITGGAHGLGRTFTLDLAAAGARVGVCDVDPAGLAAVKAEAAAVGAGLWTQTADVADEASVEALFAGFVEHAGGIDAILLRRMAEPAEIASAVRFALENDFINGRVIPVDGGLRL